MTASPRRVTIGRSFSCLLSFIYLIISEVPLFYEVSNLSAHQIGSDFSRNLITGKPDVYYQMFSNNDNNKIVVDYFQFLIINE